MQRRAGTGYMKGICTCYCMRTQAQDAEPQIIGTGHQRGHNSRPHATKQRPTGYEMQNKVITMEYCNRRKLDT